MASRLSLKYLPRTAVFGRSVPITTSARVHPMSIGKPRTPSPQQFSTTRNSNRHVTDQRTQREKPRTQATDVEIPSFSFDGLGATTPVKVVLWTSLAILACLETYFYGSWIYHYFYPDSPVVTHYLKRVYRWIYPAHEPELVTEAVVEAQKSDSQE